MHIIASVISAKTSTVVANAKWTEMCRYVAS